MRAVERRYRQHVEDRKVDVVDDYQIEDDKRAIREWQFQFREQDENYQRDERRYQIRRGTGKRYEDIVAARVAEIHWVYLHGFCPAEVNDKQHQQADWVDVRGGIERQASLHFRRIIAQRVGNTSVRPFVYCHCDDDAGQSGNKMRQETANISKQSKHLRDRDQFEILRSCW